MRVWLAQVSLLAGTLQGRASSWELPALAARHGFDGVEWLDRLLPSYEPRLLARLGQACQRAGLGPGGLSLGLQPQASPARLRLQTRRCLQLMDACPSLGVEYVRVGLGGGGLSFNGLLEGLSALRPARRQLSTPLGPAARLAYRFAVATAGHTQYRGHGKQPPPASNQEHEMASRALRPLVQKAAELGLRLGVENHWGLSGRPRDLLKLVYNLSDDNLGRNNIGICLDLNNFYEDQGALDGVAAMAPKANHVHYKAHSLDAAQEAFNLDYKAMLGLLRDEQYDWAVSIEYEGPEPALRGAIRAAETLRQLWQRPD